MTQQTFTEALTEFLDAREALAHACMYQPQWIKDQEDRLTKAGEKLDEFFIPKVTLQTVDDSAPITVEYFVKEKA